LNLPFIPVSRRKVELSLKLDKFSPSVDILDKDNVSASGELE
jgi:hypothetical protein